MTGEDGEKMRPLIGIPTSPFKHSYSEITPVNIDKEEFDYFWLLSVLTEKIVSCVRAAGGVPLLLTATRDAQEIKAAASKLDGFVFAGGSDIAPAFYGEGDARRTRDKGRRFKTGRLRLRRRQRYRPRLLRRRGQGDYLSRPRPRQL